ncbi:alpha/beta fold hydrolase [Sphingomonas sp. S2-65]|uniref:alpha/beta fold hydrolase n=1 Tax=Sphingomonas sp. S2-65 TaxID=2903960 RepID=UPI001F406027|nr:alpha/beta hydrolase [Sphingomonas sp. S2-65]UYY58410.1 alpha/beta fold hydrolase [Sphingomonas sp. S2-65]
MHRLLVLACLSTTLACSPAVAASGDRQAATALVQANGVQLAYRIAGPAKGRPLLLIAGTGMQLIEWPPELIDRLARAGFRVIVFDNRDAGTSTHFSRAGSPDWAAIFGALGAGKKPDLPYTADDMAKDAVALLDQLGIARADLLGISGGATIAALVAEARPERVRSLNLIAANSGNPQIPMPADPATLSAIPQPSPNDGAPQVLARRLASYRALAGRASGFDADAARQLIERTVARDADPVGFARQGAAMLVLGDLRPRLAKIQTPTLVIHGGDDPLISPKSGQEVADTIAGARFMTIEGMGHDLPAGKGAAIVSAVKANAARAR